MYAKSSPRGAYHLLDESETNTLCGLPVPPIIINRPAVTSTVHLTEIEPNRDQLCEKCRELGSDREERAEPVNLP